jgi:hypothetical protein
VNCAGVTALPTTAATSAEVGQMSASITGLPSASWPIGSLAKSMFIVPASA